MSASTTRPRWCETCKQQTPHIIRGRVRKCTKCQTTIEQIWMAPKGITKPWKVEPRTPREETDKP